MLIIGLIAALCLYVGLYFLYHAAESQLSNLTGILSVITQALFVPEPSIFFLLRGLILVVFLYVITDTLLSPARRGLKGLRRRRRDAERDRLAFRGAKPIQPPEDDEDSLDSSSLAPPHPRS